MVFVVTRKIVVNVIAIVTHAPGIKSTAPYQAGKTTSAVTITVPGKTRAACRILCVAFEEFLISATGQHFAFGFELIWILNLYPQIGIAQKLSKGFEEGRVSGPSAETPQTCTGQWWIDRNKAILG